VASTPYGSASYATAASERAASLILVTAPARGEAAQHPQRVHAVELVVSECGDDQRIHRLHAASDDPEHVEGGGVGPVEVLEHDHRGRALSKLAHQPGRELMRFRARSRERELLELASGQRGDVEERRQGSRRNQRIARSGHQLHGGGQRGREPADERCLADAGLSGHESQPPARPRGHRLELFREGGQLGRPLEEVGFASGCSRGLGHGSWRAKC